MPVEFLVSVLLVSVVANGALLLWLARADHITIHWPLRKSEAGGAEWPGLPSRGAPPARRRALFVAGQSQPGATVRSAIPISTGNPAPGSAPLPPELAELLAPAPIAPHADARSAGAGHYGGNGTNYGGNGNGNGGNGNNYGSSGNGVGFRPGSPDGTLVRMQATSSTDSGHIAVDTLTGLEDQKSWSRIIEVENSRLLRYRRPSTIVMAEVDGLRKLSERMGEEPVGRLLPVVADAFRNEARSSDWIARIGYGRFAAFLAETDEIAAINYVERIRQICEPWLSSAAVPLRLAIGWSSPSAASDLEYAIKRAEERMHADRRLPAKLPAPRGVAPRVVALTGGDPAVEAVEEDRGPTLVSPADPGGLETLELDDAPRGPRALP